MFFFGGMFHWSVFSNCWKFVFLCRDIVALPMNEQGRFFHLRLRLKSQSRHMKGTELSIDAWKVFCKFNESFIRSFEVWKMETLSRKFLCIMPSFYEKKSIMSYHSFFVNASLAYIINYIVIHKSYCRRENQSRPFFGACIDSDVKFTNTI